MRYMWVEHLDTQLAWALGSRLARGEQQKKLLRPPPERPGAARGRTVW